MKYWRYVILICLATVAADLLIVACAVLVIGNNNTVKDMDATDLKQEPMIEIRTDSLNLPRVK